MMRTRPRITTSRAVQALPWCATGRLLKGSTAHPFSLFGSGVSKNAGQLTLSHNCRFPEIIGSSGRLHRADLSAGAISWNRMEHDHSKACETHINLLVLTSDCDDG